MAGTIPGTNPAKNPQTSSTESTFMVPLALANCPLLFKLAVRFWGTGAGRAGGRKGITPLPMAAFVFEVTRRDGLARIGRLQTRHGFLETPALLPVVNPNRPTIPPREMAERFQGKALITNAYVLHRGEWRGKALAGGVHRLLDFGGVVMTDSGAFQQHVYGDVAVGNREIVEFQRDLGTDLGTVLDRFSEPSHDRERASEDLEET